MPVPGVLPRMVFRIGRLMESVTGFRSSVVVCGGKLIHPFVLIAGGVRVNVARL